MRKIEVGMLVRIKVVNCPTGRSDISKYEGHIGVVKELWDTHPDYGDRWTVSGASEDSLCWIMQELHPINPDAEPCDESFREAFKNMDSLSRWLSKETDKCSTETQK